MSRQLKILFLEDVSADAELESRELRRGGVDCVTQRVETKEAFVRALDEFEPDVILCDFSLPTFDGLSALDIAQEKRPDAPFLFVSGTIGEERAIESLKRGATDYILKTNLRRLVPSVRRAMQDVEERVARRRAEQEVAEQREFYRNVIDLDRNFIFAKDREGRFTLVNQALAEAYGCSVNDLLAKTDADFNPNREEVAHFRKLDLEVMDTLREAFIPEERITDAAGRVRWLQTVKRPLVSADGTANMVLGVSNDITERKRNEEALRESEYRLDLALEASDIATWEWNLATREVRFSRHWWPILGYQPDDIPLRIEAWEKLTHPDDLVRVKSMLAATINGSVPVLDVEYRMRAKSGEWRWIRTVGRVVERDAAGRTLRKTGTHGDITERKKQEQKIARLSRIHAVLSGINSLIVRVRDRQVLFNDACRIAVEHGGFGIAWIGVLNQETLEITPAACAGVDAELFLARSQNTARPDTPMGQGVVGCAIREKRAVSSNDITTEPGVGGERRKEATRRGYRSSISLPLLMEGTAVGNFSLFAKEANFFNADEVKLLTELAGDISFALEYIGKEEKLNYLAYYDALTGLPNRALFDNRVTQCLRVANHEKSKVALVLINLERFRVINDTFGRHAADGLLKLVAKRLQSVIFDRDSLARIQGDVFAALFNDIKDEANIARIVEEKIIACLSQPFTIAGQELRVSAKAGVALFPGDATEPDALFSSAEAALRQAKGSSDRYLFYARKMNAQVAERLKLENKLQRALEREQFVLFYQPKVDLSTERVVGVEALIRWNDPDTGLVLPSLFIPLLEETGMIVEVGPWVMKRAVSQYAAWLATGLQPPWIAVNVSQVQLKRKDFVTTVQRAIAIAGKPDHGLDLEITESMIMEDIESSIEKLKIVRDLGVGIAIDDFGTGYSSLRYLTRLPITALKIDRAFVQHMTTNPDAVAIVTTVIALAHNLHLRVIAEGVETEEQSKFLRLLTCDEIQGYLSGKPVPAEQVPALLESKSLALPAATTY